MAYPFTDVNYGIGGAIPCCTGAVGTSTVIGTISVGGLGIQRLLHRLLYGAVGLSKYPQGSPVNQRTVVSRHPLHLDLYCRLL